MAWLAEQEGDLKRELERAEMSLYKFKKDRNLLAVSLDDKQSMLSANLASVNAKLTDLRIKILELDSKRKIIEHARTNIAEEETIPEIREKDTIRALREAFIQQSKESADLSSKYGPEHPKIKALASQMETTRKIYVAEIDGVLATFEKSYRALVDNERGAARHDGVAEERGDRAIEDRGRVQAAAAGRRSEHQDVRPDREPPEGDRHHRPDEDEQRPDPRAGDRAGLTGAAQAGAEPAARPADRARHRRRAGVRHRGARQHAEDAGRRRAVPGRAGAGSRADHRRRARRRRGTGRGQRPRTRSGRVPGSEIGRGRVLPLDPHQHPVHVAGPSAADDRRHQPEPAGRARRPPRSTSASPWRRPVGAC